MTNRDKVEKALEKAQAQVKAAQAASATYQAMGDETRACFADMDAHYAEEEVLELSHRLASLTSRNTEIARFEAVTGVEWDAWNWDLPPGDLITWWESVSNFWTVMGNI